MALNDIDAAVESFKKALQLEPNDGKYHTFLVVYEMNNEFRKTRFGNEICWGLGEGVLDTAHSCKSPLPNSLPPVEKPFKNIISEDFVARFGFRVNPDKETNVVPWAYMYFQLWLCAKKEKGEK